jgi:hypothetical protein
VQYGTQWGPSIIPNTIDVIDASTCKVESYQEALSKKHLKKADQVGVTGKSSRMKEITFSSCKDKRFSNLQNGRIYSTFNNQAQLVVNPEGGVFYIENNSCKIFQSKKGKLFNDSLLTIVKTQKASLFQQIQCIENGTAAKFKDKKLFQRRGIAILKDNSVAIIESEQAITLEVFSKDLVLLNVKQLIYTDMGAWDEGWYRNPLNNVLKKIGKDLSQTDKQSNLIVFRK